MRHSSLSPLHPFFTIFCSFQYCPPTPNPPSKFLLRFYSIPFFSESRRCLILLWKSSSDILNFAIRHYRFPFFRPYYHFPVFIFVQPKYCYCSGPVPWLSGTMAPSSACGALNAMWKELQVRLFCRFSRFRVFLKEQSTHEIRDNPK